MSARLFSLRWVLAACLLSIPLSATAEQWSPAQEAVWQTVEAYGQMFQKGDLEGALAYFHDDYHGWYNGNALPNSKASLRLWLPHYFQTRTTLISELHPLSTQPFGDVAVVHHKYSDLVQEGGANKAETGRWTDVLSRQNGRWLVIGDHGGGDSN